MSNIRQTILVRTDLGFSVGLMAAQCSHIHMEQIRQAILRNTVPVAGIIRDELFSLPTDTLEWIKSPYVFIHGVPNKEVLEYFIKRAKALGVEVSEWRDNVFIDISDSQRESFPDTFVGVSLGPTDSDKIKAVIGDLPLLSK